MRTTGHRGMVTKLTNDNKGIKGTKGEKKNDRKKQQGSKEEARGTEGRKVFYG